MKLERTVVVANTEDMCDLMCGQSEEHEYCLRCGRKLKNPDARLIGYGVVCLKKMRTEKTIKKLF